MSFTQLHIVQFNLVWLLIARGKPLQFLVTFPFCSTLTGFEPTGISAEQWFGQFARFATPDYTNGRPANFQCKLSQPTFVPWRKNIKTWPHRKEISIFALFAKLRRKTEYFARLLNKRKLWLLGLSELWMFTFLPYLSVQGSSQPWHGRYPNWFNSMFEFCQSLVLNHLIFQI